MRWMIALCLAALSAGGFAQGPELPHVVSGALPTYPPIARAAHVSGTVRIKVTTDGHKAELIELVSGPPILVSATRANIATWEFSNHKPTTFITEFVYAVEGEHCGPVKQSVEITVPTEIRIAWKDVELCTEDAMAVK